MMKKKTYNNVMELTKVIMKKGYTEKESAELAVKCFDNYVEGGISVEAIADRIINKEQWQQEYR
jgi:N-acetylglucosamine kinase-like BadF-type ATPase